MWIDKNWETYGFLILIISPFCWAAILIWLNNAEWGGVYNGTAVVGALTTFLLAVLLWVTKKDTEGFLYTVSCLQTMWGPARVCFGADHEIFAFVIFSTAIFPFCLIPWWNEGEFRKEVFPPLFVTQGFWLLTLIAMDEFVFYVCFGAFSIPLFLVLGIYLWRDQHFSTGTYIHVIICSVALMLFFAVFYNAFQNEILVNPEFLDVWNAVIQKYFVMMLFLLIILLRSRQ